VAAIEPSQPKGGDRARIIAAIDHPLGFYVLALLITEAFFSWALNEVNQTDRLTVIWIMVGVFVLVITIVTLLVVFLPGNLNNAHVVRSMEAIKVDLIEAQAEVDAVRAVINSSALEDLIQEIAQREIANQGRPRVQPPRRSPPELPPQ